LAVSAVLAGTFLAGCYASTEPATEVGPESARLRAQGTANNGPAYSFFEYWVTGSNLEHKTTDSVDWPAGASGPFSLKALYLSASSSYSFRVCGGDDTIEAPVCANTRTFVTGTAVEDAVIGGYSAGCCANFHVHARSGPAGENPNGTMSVGEMQGQSSINFTGTVTCLQISGDQAKVGAVGERQVDGVKSAAIMLASIVDGHPNSDPIEWILQAGSTPPNCAAAPPFGTPEPGGRDHLVVNDARPLPGLR
jgi:hypothetical protein